MWNPGVGEAMSDSESNGRITENRDDGRLELRSKGSPEAWIQCENPAIVER